MDIKSLVKNYERAILEWRTQGDGGAVLSVNNKKKLEIINFISNSVEMKIKI